MLDLTYNLTSIMYTIPELFKDNIILKVVSDYACFACVAFSLLIEITINFLIFHKFCSKPCMV